MASSSSTSNRWLSNILRPRASSITVESCLNLQNSDPTCPLDARLILPLVSSNQQPLATRCKHIRVFTELCKSYKFTHLDNVFFAVKDILDQPEQQHTQQQQQQQQHSIQQQQQQHYTAANQDARHAVFEFMIAAIEGQYDELGMARVTFYNSLRDYTNWDDFADMYRVLFALCKGGRDISGFEKNVGKLLIQWMKQVALKDVKGDALLLLLTNSTTKRTTTVTNSGATVVPFLGDIMHLLTVIAKFNFAMFEENEVTDMIEAAKLALFSSNHSSDIKTCLAFADVVVRYRFVPFEALQPFMDILCVSVMLPQDRAPPADTGESPWSIFMNLLRSHCAHNAILTLCNGIAEIKKQEVDLTSGAITLLTQASWGNNNNRSSVSESYQVPDSILLMFLRRAATQRQSELVNAKILESLKILVENQGTISLLEWDTIWDICDVCTEQLLRQFQHQGNNNQQEARQVVRWFPSLYMDNGTGTSMVYQFIRFLACVYNQYVQHKRYTGPVGRLMKVIYALRHHISPEGAQILLTYYENEHMLLPSDDNWIERLKEIVNTFFIPPDIAGTVRLRVLSILTDVCMSTKDFYSDIMNTQIIYPMVQGAPQETNAELRQRTVDLIVLALSDTQNFNNEENMFDQLLDVLRRCASCKCLDDLRSSRIPIAASRGVASAIAQATTTGSTSATLGTHREDDRSRTATLRRSQSQSNHGSTSSPRIHYTMSKSSTASPLSASSPIISDGSITSEGQCCSGVPAMYGLVQLFEELLLGSDAKACLKVFRTITSISNNMDDLLCPYGGSMVVALDMMLCLRCPPDHRVYMTDDPFENDNNLMATIRQTQNARRREAMNRDKSATMMMGSVSLPHHQQQQEQQQEQPQRSRYPSPVMLSHSENQEHHEQGRVLPIGELLEAYIVVLSHSSNWELVLFVLKRLPIQLGNKHMFCGAPGTIEKLRRSITGWIHSRDFLKNVHSIPPTIKRNDVYVYAYNILVVLISYRRLFDKQRQDEIVFAFYMGLTQITAATKPCIHALSVCCHELPLSVTKMLNEILQRMSQIISVSSVSVHILEFLSTLARLPGLYANFTSDMYKPVFAIALNYLQHTQSSSASSTTSSPISTPPTPHHHHHHHHHHHQQTPPASSSSSSSQQQQQQQNSKNSKDAQQITTQNALSQYVLIMAYLVITVWFTAVPLRERRKHVSFIIGRLLSATPIGKGIDEQTFTCIDMLSRFSFADVSLSPEKSLVSKILMGDPAAGPSPLTGAGNTTANSEGGIRQSMRTWVYGHTLLTLKTAKALGWVEMTIRRPSGTVSMMCNIENRIKSNAIDYQTLPALLMMQYTPDLMASRMLQQRESGNAPGNDTSSPLPLVESGLGITFENLAAAANIATQQYQQQQQNSGNVDEEQQEQQTNNDSSPASGATEGNSGGSGSGSGTVSIGGQTPMTAGNNNNNNIHEQVDNVIRQVLADPETPAQSISSSGLLRRMDQPLDPGFLFLQLSNYPDLTRIGENIPPLPEDEATTRSLGILDRIPVVDFHKIGVLYVGKGQHTEVDILANTHGSPEYVKLLNALGEIELLKGRTDNTGGLDREMDIDGRFAYFWKDDVTRVIFHVATLMPTNLERDPQCSNKKRHIGNDFVTIVYNDSGKDYAFDTLPGQFNFCNIVITPHSISSFTPSTASSISPSSSTLSSITTSSDSDNNTFFKVEMQRRPDMPEIGPISEPKLVSGQSLPHLVRQTALHANIFAQVFQSVSAGGGRREYVSPWKERLRQIKRIRDRVTKSATNDQQAPPSSSTPAITVNNKVPFEQVLDFTKYT